MWLASKILKMIRITSIKLTFIDEKAGGGRDSFKNEFGRPNQYGESELPLCSMVTVVKKCVYVYMFSSSARVAFNPNTAYVLCIFAAYSCP